MSSIRSSLLSCNVRTVATSCLIVVAMLVGASEASAQSRGRNSVPRSFDVLPVTITSVTMVNGSLVANGLFGTTPFSTPLTMTPQAAAPGECPILDLRLGPIDLTLLGLNVKTSDICVEVTAIQGGGLLGDLLCGVANLLSPDGANAAAVIGNLLEPDRTRVLNGLTSLLDGVFDRIASNNVSLAGTTCDILNLSLGPLNLNLLGLEVVLDNCGGGPVTVDITAIQGGGLLGDLLCGLSNLLSGGASPLSSAVQRLLFQVSQLLGALA